MTPYDDLLDVLKARRRAKDNEARAHDLAAEEARDESKLLGAAIMALEEQVDFQMTARELLG